MKTFAVTLGKDMAVDGIPMKAGDQVAAITSEVSPHTVLGLLQFQHATAEEITDAMDDEDDSESDEAGEPEPSETQPEPLSDDVIQSQPTPEPVQESAPVSPSGSDHSTAPVAAFMADGLDEKTARALVESNGIDGPDELREMLAAGLKLTELADIGSRRAQQIATIYAPSTVEA